MTSKTSAPAEVYAEQLSRLNYGFPLWHPDPPNDAPEIQIGDVGFVRDGAFYRMFNATQPGDSLINGGHVPPGHEPFEFRTDKSFIKIRDAIGKGPLSSKTIEKVAIKGSAGESSHHVSTGFKFQCKGNQGAVLMMNHGADLEAIHGSHSLVKYMEANWDGWLSYISEDSGLDIEVPKKPGLMFISGVHKTVDWAVASYVSGGKSAEFSLSADAVAASGAFSLEVSSRTDIAPIYNWGPRHRQTVQPSSSTSSLEGSRKDQSVFINYYAMKRRLGVFPPAIMKAAAGYHNLPPADRDAGSDVAMAVATQDVEQLETDRSASQYRDPVNAILDYILEKEDRVDLALASDRDIGALCKHYGCEFSDDPSEFLQAFEPSLEILESGVGILANGSVHAELHSSGEELQVQEASHPSGPSNLSPGTSSEPADPDVGMLPSDQESAKYRGNIPPGDVVRGKQTGDAIILEHRRAGDATGPGAAGITALAYSPDGRYIASGGDDALIIIWDISTGTSWNQCDGHMDTICALTFSPDSQRLVSCANDNLTIVWSVETGNTLLTLEAHTDTVCSVAYSPDGAFIATGSFDNSARLWDANTGEQRPLSGGGNAVVLSVAFSPDSRQLVSASADYCARVWDAKGGQLLHLLEGHQGVINAIAYAPDNRRLATGSEDGSIRIWDSQSGAMLVDLREHTGSVWAVGFSADGKHLLSAASDGAIKVCDSYGGELLHEIDAGDKLMTAAAFSADGTRICASSADKYIWVWDAEEGVPVKTIPGQAGQVSQLLFSPDAKHVASSSDDGLLRIWSIDSPDVIMSA